MINCMRRTSDTRGRMAEDGHQTTEVGNHPRHIEQIREFESLTFTHLH